MHLTEKYVENNKQYTFHKILALLESFWRKQDCKILLPFDTEMGAATFHPSTIINVLRNNPTNIAFMQPCRRPQDARGGQNPNRLYKHHQFQVIMMPPPENIQTLVLHSLYSCGITSNLHNIDFVENNWSSPSLGATGKGYEVQCNGTEILQFTYFQQIGGMDLELIPIELAYGLERLCLVIQGVDHIYDAIWENYGHNSVKYGEINGDFETAHIGNTYSITHLQDLFNNFEKIFHDLMSVKSYFAAYEVFLKMSHTFNLIESTGDLGVNDRLILLGRTRQSATESIKMIRKILKDEGVVND